MPIPLSLDAALAAHCAEPAAHYARRKWRISALDGRHPWFNEYPADYSVADVERAEFWRDDCGEGPLAARVLAAPADALGPWPAPLPLKGA